MASNGNFETQKGNTPGFQCRSDKYKYVTEASEHLLCSICFNPMWPPKLLNCGHSFCQHCIEYSMNEIGKKCPFCNQCIESVRDCSYSLKSLCGELMVECPNWRCCQVIKRRDEIDYHFANCWANKCTQSDMHQIGKCGLQMVKCPNDGCNANIRRYKLENHQTKQCLFVNKKKKKKILVLTQAQRDRIQQNKQRALQRRAALNSNNYSLSDEVRRRIEQNKQRALQRRRAQMSQLSQ